MAFTNSANKTFITDIPQAPRNFFNVVRLHGTYVLGHSSYAASRFSIVPLIQRKIGNRIVGNNFEEFAVGVLTVLLIGLLAEIVQSVVMRTRNRKLTEDHVYTAFLLDEFYHFRNVWKHATDHSNRSSSIYRRVLRNGGVLISLFTVCTAIVCFGADVISVYVTQPTEFTSTADEFNLRAIQPVRTTIGRAKHIRRQVWIRPCISPRARFQLQRRNFLISSCTFHQSKESTTTDTDVVTFSSWYHRGGNDHNITFGDGWISTQVRANLLVDNRAQSTKRILFNSTSDLFNGTKYLHELAMYTAIEADCNKKVTKKSCLQMESELEAVSTISQTKNVVLWTTMDGKNVTSEVTGVVSTFRLRLNRPFTAYTEGMSVLMTSSAILEVKNLGWYEDILTEEQVRGIPGLISEDGRVSGLYILSCFVGGGLIVVIILRFTLEPRSLSHLAFLSLQREKARRELLRANVDLSETSSEQPSETERRWKGGSLTTTSESNCDSYHMTSVGAKGLPMATHNRLWKLQLGPRKNAIHPNVGPPEDWELDYENKTYNV